MAQLNENQFARILDQLRGQLKYGPLIEELADHVACATESYMDSGYDFERAYAMAMQHFGPAGIQQTEQETLRIASPKLFRFMKIIRWTLFFSYVLTGMGALFKFVHWPTANELTLAGLVSIAICAFVSGFIRFETTDNNALKPSLFAAFRLVYMLGMVNLAMGTLFKVLNWPGGSQMILIGTTSILISGLLVLLDFKGYRQFFAFNKQYLRRIYLAPIGVVVLTMCWYAFLYRFFR